MYGPGAEREIPAPPETWYRILAIAIGIVHGVGSTTVDSPGAGTSWQSRDSRVDRHGEQRNCDGLWLEVGDVSAKVVPIAACQHWPVGHPQPRVGDRATS
ncbi:hypothetical protein DCS_06098 [Drechmeria coniospora]|uniref:Uncharacterized protein n=1 Tax=Drechmeria coniospora TaxID=98403 RepID=A0A151GAN7_DRECN|nr:hypothetical protein DCS_06098 [Drechmeria coniospora]KYK54141.1 hypothetical protein DCS_06098 [Drechmeria coniospora]